MNLSISLTVNGVRRDVELGDPRVTLLDLLRERLDLTGTKKGCDRGQCGACTVLVDGRRINSCLTLALSHDGASILTIEGVAEGDRLHPVQEAFIAHDGLQCGFCTLGQIMSDIGLIQEGQAGADAERVRECMSGNICRCGAYQGITEAVLQAQKTIDAASRKEGTPGPGCHPDKPSCLPPATPEEPRSGALSATLDTKSYGRPRRSPHTKPLFQRLARRAGSRSAGWHAA